MSTLKLRSVAVIPERMVEHQAAAICTIAMAGMIHELRIPEFEVKKERHDSRIHIYYSDYAETLIADSKHEIEAALEKRLDPILVQKLMVTLFGYSYYE